MSQNKILEFPDADPAFRMIDVGRKRITRRRAVAEGTIMVGAAAFAKIRDKALPKGDVLALAEIAGINGAKRTHELLPMCHTLPLDQAAIHCVLEAPDTVRVYCQVAAHAKTGVEMEAITGAQIALATIWDLTKGTEPNLTISAIRLLVKEGGKSGLWVNPDGIPDWLAQQLPDRQPLEGMKAAILVMSDRAAMGTYEDRSGPVLKEALGQAGAAIAAYEIIPDDQAAIAENIEKICRNHRPDLLIASGGTGPGPRDVTPEALAQISDRMLEGLGDMLRAESLFYTDTAWLSRMSAGMVGETLVIAFPGSPKAVRECWDIIAPFIGDALIKIKKQGFEALS